MITDKETNTIYFSEKLIEQSPEIANQISSSIKLFGADCRFLPGTKDIWARDYMPVQVNKHKLVQYTFYPDYLLDYEYLKSEPESICDDLKLNTIKSDIVLDGGNVVKSDNCVIMTDKIVIENIHKYNKEQLLSKLRDLFEVEKIVLIPWDHGERYGHADGMVRFIDNETVLLQGYYNTRKDLFIDDFIETLLDSLKKNHLKYEFLDIDYSEKINAKFAYLNYLQTKDFILLPSLGIEKDDEALEAEIKKYFPDYTDRIQKIKMNSIIAKGGALNCISWTIKE
ncbi:MAG: agmatine deiminase family protein [Paludibacter sp.]|nr:agmatine deiminase family protein [Paludibacter sp.]